jgi:hypothetical protein
MHTSTFIDVVLGISSNPIIEHCSNVRFASSNGVGATGATTQEAGSLPYVPQDFSHIRGTPSPNWSVLRDFDPDSLQRDVNQ